MKQDLKSINVNVLSDLKILCVLVIITIITIVVIIIIVLTINIILALCYYPVTYAFQSESTL